MLHTNFFAHGVCHCLVTVGISKREQEAIAENIKPEKLTRTDKRNLACRGLDEVKIPKAHKDRGHKYKLPKAKRVY